MCFTKPPRLVALIAMTGVVFAGAGAQEPGSKDSPRLSLADVEKLHRFLKPQPGESRWMEIDWHPSVWEARRKAAAEGKPLFLWYMAGEPLGTC